MKKTIATTLAALTLAAVSIGVAQPAAAAPYYPHYPSMHPSMHVVFKHPKHWHQHLLCTTKWRHHHKVTFCVWVPNHK